MTQQNKRAYMRAYNQRPEVKARRKVYNQRPDVMKKAREYQRANRKRSDITERERIRKQTPEYLAWRTAYLGRSAVRARRRAREQAPQAKAKKREYRSRPEVRERSRLRYRSQRYRETAKVRSMRYRARPEVQDKEKRRYIWNQTNPNWRLNRQSYLRRYRTSPTGQTKIKAYFKKPEVIERQKRLARLRRRRDGVPPRTQTKPEQSLELLLHTHFPGDWRYTGQGDVVIGRCAPDFFQVNGKKGIIEVYGCYHHGCPTCGHPSPHANSQRDAKRLKMFEDLGLKTLVVWEHELKAAGAVVQRVKETFYQ